MKIDLIEVGMTTNACHVLIEPETGPNRVLSFEIHVPPCNQARRKAS